MHPGCNKSFNTHGNLKSHSFNHVEVKEFKCTIDGCSKTYNHKSRLDIHLRTHVGFKPFKCEIPGCNKTFNENGNLRTHMRSHSGSKPYKCVEIGCKASFKFSINLKYHLKTHKKNNQNFYCVYCPMTFTRYNTLQTHIEIHKEEELKPSCQSLLKNKRAQTAEDLIQKIHPRQYKSAHMKEAKGHVSSKRLSMSTNVDANLSLNHSEFKEEDTENLAEASIEDNNKDYYDFQNNLSLLFKFAKNNFKSNSSNDIPNSIVNLKLQLGTLLQDHNERVNTFKSVTFDSPNASL